LWQFFHLNRLFHQRSWLLLLIYFFKAFKNVNLDVLFKLWLKLDCTKLHNTVLYNSIRSHWHILYTLLDKVEIRLGMMPILVRFRFDVHYRYRYH
jgi:hypothetical protein